MPTVVQEPKNLSEVSFEQRKRELNEMAREEQEMRRRERKSPFTRFYQVNKDSSEYLRSCLDENPTALKILFFLFDHMDKYNAVMCSNKVMGEALCISRTTIARAIKYLKEHGFLYIYKSGVSNVYVTNPNLVWNSWGSNWEYCEFPANILLSKSEQEKLVDVYDKRLQITQIRENEPLEAAGGDLNA